MSLIVNVNINAPELAGAIHALADALSGRAGTSNNGNGASSQSKPALVTKPKAEPAAPEPVPVQAQDPEPEAKQETKAESTDATPKVTLEVVRAKLAAIAQAGKQAQVKELLSGFGVAKLTEVPADQYGKLLAEAEKIA